MLLDWGSSEHGCTGQHRSHLLVLASAVIWFSHSSEMAAWASSKKRRVSCCMLMTLQNTRDVQTEAGQVQSEVRIYRDIIISVSQMLIPHYPGARCLECYEPWHQAAASYLPPTPRISAAWLAAVLAIPLLRGAPAQFTQVLWNLFILH